MELYCYRATVLRVVDGDTLDLDVDLGMDVHVHERVRIAGIDAPETYGVKKESEEYMEGLKAKVRLHQLVMGEDIMVQTRKDKKGKYGRYIADVLVLEGDTWVSVGEKLIQEGLAEAKEY